MTNSVILGVGHAIPSKCIKNDDFSSMDYESHVFGQKSYNGVAIISKHKLNNVRTDLIKDRLKQSRIISSEITHKKKNIQIILNYYSVPSMLL